jgi:spermidine/putrescine transport system permease protein
MTTTSQETSARTRNQAGARSLRRAPNRMYHWLDRLSKLGLGMYGLLGFLFLYTPIVLVIVFSFNASSSTAQMNGTSLRWYGEMLSDSQLLLALWNSLFVALISTVIATVLGTLAALAMERYRFWGRFGMDALLYLPIIIPDIAMAIMLLIFFNLSGLGFEPWRFSLFGVRFAVPYSVIIGHVAFNISFVVVIVRARLVQMDNVLEEAAQDLYANAWQTFRRVTLPMLVPGILAGALLAFTLSLDDFVITFFTSGAGFNTLPTYIFGMIKRGITPKINAISTVMLVVSLLLVTLSIFLRRRDSNSKSPIDLGL